MKKIQFQININAPAARVYDMMLGLSDIATYESWTAEFNPNSTYEGRWEKGSKICFTGTDQHGNKGGMVSEIAENIPDKFVSIRHYGILQGDKEITEGPDVEQWAGGCENYHFTEQDGTTTVTVEVDVTEDYTKYFDQTYPKALDRLKQIAEK